MKEKIYTIPVTEAFSIDCECPMCLLEKKLENEYIDYTLGPSLMEPDSRVETNGKGFCRRHFEMLFNSQVNKLGLGLIIDTMMAEQNSMFRQLYEKNAGALKKDSAASAVKAITNKVSSRQNDTEKFIDEMVSRLSKFEISCVICDKINYTMDRYIDVILYLWSREPEFRETFNNRKGFCLVHFRQLLEGAKKYMGSKEMASFVISLTEIQLNNMERVQGEVNWFTKKFDYRYNDEPWGNSKDALQRSIQKLSKFCELK